ncbi:hypothetical protein E1293_07580 [Actinomadura darangshiensis]|uniref:Uncharacterized protein n=1 Tax=Actinomadura darangshiensis TaxID=705336 RepID=A0A4V2YX20_9ACTN|nr:hypothetical protein [Actinomadura darangshiensis]TDD87667.1 hypothetical protein E1293_07580 [Actinomadura darangshiensis]
MIDISAAIMHHPRRAERIPALVRACAPLAPAVVADPEPDGRPSPLRTAKRAWAAIAPGATHHMVLQDDVRLVPGFAEQLHRAVSGRPDHGVSLFCLWHTPHNSYLVRRAAVAGAAYAPLSPYEWTPTQAFVLPVEQARALADHLAGIPDEVQDDDEMIVIFCREQGIPVVTTVPHLLDSGHERSLVEGHSDGLRATVYTPGTPWPADGAAGPDLPPGACAVELFDSVCSIRMIYGDPVEHQFPWYWYDACPLMGFDPEAVLDAGAAHLSGLPAGLARTMSEVWAAAYLLGADVARLVPGLPGSGTLTRVALESWIDQGLSTRDREAAGPLRDDCVRLAMAAVRQALSDRRLAHA